MGKLNFSPNLEQTPKARSSKNNFNFSMDCGGIVVQKYKICFSFL